MEPAEVVDHIAERLASSGYKTKRVKLAGHDALVGRRSDFRLKWFATRLHTFVIVFIVADLDVEIAEALTAASQEYAIKHKEGLPRGLQTGSAAVSVFLSRESRPNVHHWFSAEPTRSFAAFRFPLLIELDSWTPIYFRGRALWGAVYMQHLRSVAGNIISLDVRPAS